MIKHHPRYACDCTPRLQCEPCASRRHYDKRTGGDTGVRSADYFTTAEVALLLNVSQGTVRLWLMGVRAIPVLPSVRRGERGQHFVHRDALRMWLDTTGRWTLAARQALEKEATWQS